jgi:hypothetical protein
MRCLALGYRNRLAYLCGRCGGRIVDIGVLA